MARSEVVVGGVIAFIQEVRKRREDPFYGQAPQDFNGLPIVLRRDYNQGLKAIKWESLRVSERMGLKPLGLSTIIDISVYHGMEFKELPDSMVLSDGSNIAGSGNLFRILSLDMEKQEAQIAFCRGAGLSDLHDVQPFTVPLDHPLFTGYQVFHYTREGEPIGMSEANRLIQEDDVQFGRTRINPKINATQLNTFYSDIHGQLVSEDEFEKSLRQRTYTLPAHDGENIVFTADFLEIEQYVVQRRMEYLEELVILYADYRDQLPSLIHDIMAINLPDVIKASRGELSAYCQQTDNDGFENRDSHQLTRRSFVERLCFPPVLTILRQYVEWNNIPTEKVKTV